MVVNTAGNNDWNSVTGSPNYVHLTDLSGTTADDSFKPGQKQDTVCPVTTTSKNPPKDDFTDVASFNETNLASGDTFLYGATIRFTPNGNASENVELNKGTSGNCGVDPVTGVTLLARTPGDKLIAIDYLNGGRRSDDNLHLYQHGASWRDQDHQDVDQESRRRARYRCHPHLDALGSIVNARGGTPRAAVEQEGG